MQWTRIFSKSILERGRQYYRAGRVSKYRRQEDMHYVSVKGTKMYQVWVNILDGEVARMGCNCPYARDGYRCKHMAAALYYMEAERVMESEVLVPVEQLKMELVPETSDISDDDPYRYFDCKAMKKNFTLTASQGMKVSELIAKGQVKLDRVNIGYHGLSNYYTDSDTLRGIAYGHVIGPKNHYEIILHFEKDHISNATCLLPGCGRSYRSDSRLGPQNLCIHQIALLMLLEQYLQQYNPGDATSRTAASFLDRYRSSKLSSVPKSENEKEKALNLNLKPRFQSYHTNWSVSFKIAGNKSFVVKDLPELVKQVEEHQLVQFGSTTEWQLGIENFSEQGKRYYRFIRQVVLEEEERRHALRSAGTYYRESNSEIKDSIPLFGRRLDDFFDAVGTDAFEMNEGYGKEKKNRLMSCCDKKPDISLTIRKAEDHKKVFQGIHVTGMAPELLHTSNGAYFLDSGCLNRIPVDTMKELEPVIAICKGGDISLRIGRKRLGEFYHRILPELKKIATITELNREEIMTYLPPEVSFAFYLDAEESDFICRCDAVYGDQKRSLAETALMSQNNTSAFMQMEDYRDLESETEIMKRVQKLFPYVDKENDCFRCNGDENLMYEVLNRGVTVLLELGEVHVTDRFRNRNVRRNSNLSVGVSVESQLLDLTIASGDMTLPEILEVLDSYKRKLRYHRLKNGDFFDLESDTETLELLNQLMESMQIPLKEFVKGKMQIPVYRALYLDKMLESCEGAYTYRDKNFKSLVKDFKTIADADFEVPVGLQKTLRKYQETGYRWLRTLQTYGFGGILADDMGLGKTLQVISLLLANQGSGPALIITPASLVYNWGEEFRRFAPQLTICLLIGTQKERIAKLKNSPDCDVFITSYDLLKRDISEYADSEFMYEILDEAQYIKNHTTAAAKAVKIIKSQQRYALTGTPIENRLSELWSIFDYLMPGYLYSYDRFRKTFETPIVKHQDENVSERLTRMVSPFILRRLKEQVLRDLPDKLEEIRYVKPEAEQQKLLDSQVAHMRTMLEQTDDMDFGKNKLKILAELVRIRQLCCDPALCFEDYHGGSAKREACVELIQTAIAGEHKILVFSQFTSMLELLEHDMQSLGIPYYQITGSTPKEERIRLVNAFNKDQTPVFFISLKAGGTGLNLIGADMVIHYDPWWNLAVQNQATDRAHRIGQTKVVTVYKMIVKNSIEEKILMMQETKKNLADEILRGENGQISTMSKDELLDLLEME